MRYIQRIETDDIKDKYSPESYINITLPKRNVDLHTFTLYYKGYAQPAKTGGVGFGGANFTLKRFFPRLNQSIISELIIEIDGVQKQHIKEFGYLYNMLHDINREDEDLNSTSFDTVLNHEIDNANGDIVKIAKVQASGIPPYNDQFYINKWLGFLNEGDRYIDCTNRDIRIRIRLAPSSILYKGVNTTGTAIPDDLPSYYELSDVYASIDILDKIPETISSNKFVDYITILGNNRLTDKHTSLTFEMNKPITWLLGTFTSSLRTTETELLMSHLNTAAKYGATIVETLTDIADFNNNVPHEDYYNYQVAQLYKKPYTLNNSRYFQRSGKGILHCVFNINGTDISPKLSLLGCYKETKKCFNTEYKRVISLASFEEDFFCNAIRLDDDQYNFKRIQWDVKVDTARFSEGGMPIVFICTEGSY